MDAESPDVARSHQAVHQQKQHRVRKRTANACIRCRQQKIKCTGSNPCEPCNKRGIVCSFDDKQHKVLVSRTFLNNLRRRARGSGGSRDEDFEDLRSPRGGGSGQSNGEHHDADEDMHETQPEPTQTRASQLGIELESESEPESGAISVTDDQRLTNPLISNPMYTATLYGNPDYLGTSSNWSFGRRIHMMVHEKVTGTPLTSTNLLFDGFTYDLGWDGSRTTVEVDNTALPTADFALFLINAVKFHCGQLFHLFDEPTFMQHFSNFHEDSSRRQDCPNLWFVHYLLVLALGKAFIVRTGQGRRPPGADLFVQAMKLLPDMTMMCTEPLQSIEIWCCAALYLQCADMRKAAFGLIGQAIRTAIVEGLHTDVQSHLHSNVVLERCREIWWTVYVLDCHMSSLMGAPLAFSEQDISARLPYFAGSAQKSLALSLHVKLAKITAHILQTVYGREGRMNKRFLSSMKNALKSLADINDERMAGLPLDLKRTNNSISRLAAYLHLFHHQCIMLTTRPLLFSFWQKRLRSPTSLRITSKGGARSLIRVCVGSAHQSIKILAALQAQSLLESFIPFDLESIWSAALVLLLTNVVDPSLLREDIYALDTVHAVLDEMIAKGNLVAGYRKDELEQLDRNFRMLSAMTMQPASANEAVMARFEGEDANWDAATQSGSTHSHLDFEPLQGWTGEDALSSDQLVAVADSLNFSGLDWLWTPPME